MRDPYEMAPTSEPQPNDLLTWDGYLEIEWDIGRPGTSLPDLQLSTPKLNGAGASSFEGAW